MSFRVRRFLTTMLIVSLLIQMHIAANGYAARGTKIAFTSNRDGNTEIYAMGGDGGNQRRLTVNPTIDDNPAWSPDGKKIAYDAYLNPEDPDLSPREIFVMDADGNNKRQLAEEGGVHPSWSPDGKRIAFVGGINVNQINVMDADGRNQKRLTHDFVHKRMPSWSPDGMSIAYVGDHRIYVMDSDGENQRKLTKINGDEHPTWSPDSDTIAFQSWGKAGELEIYLVDVTSGAVNLMLHVPGLWNYHPDWLYPGELSVSPAGNHITIWGRLKQLAPNLR